MAGIGLDVGTSFIVKAQDSNGHIEYKDFRDAFYIIKPSSPVATKMIEKGFTPVIDHSEKSSVITFKSE